METLLKINPCEYSALTKCGKIDMLNKILFQNGVNEDSKIKLVGDYTLHEQIELNGKIISYDIRV